MINNPDVPAPAFEGKTIERVKIIIITGGGWIYCFSRCSLVRELYPEYSSDKENHDAKYYIQEYYHLQREFFCMHIKAVVEILEKILDLKDNQVPAPERNVVAEFARHSNCLSIEEKPQN